MKLLLPLYELRVLIGADNRLLFSLRAVQCCTAVQYTGIRSSKGVYPLVVYSISERFHIITVCCVLHGYCHGNFLIILDISYFYNTRTLLLLLHTFFLI